MDRPDAWMLQVARNLLDIVDGFLERKRFLLLDRDPLYTSQFRALLSSAGVTPIRLPASPRPGTTTAVVVRWNGRVVARLTLSAPTRVTWFISRAVGVNDLEIEAEPGAVGIGTLHYAGA